jgi:uncharacterized protein YndB with AHSA1/START domain
MSTSTLPAIERSLTVDVPPDWAFRFFTEKIGDWWPLEDYSTLARNGRRPDEVVFEPGVGGRVYERLGDKTAVWGVVNAWDPPNRVVFSWRVNPEWPDETEVEITFSPQNGGTRVQLRHTGWERLGDRAEAARAGYADGWGDVLENYEAALGAVAAN